MSWRNVKAVVAKAAEDQAVVAVSDSHINKYTCWTSTNIVFKVEANPAAAAPPAARRHQVAHLPVPTRAVLHAQVPEPRAHSVVAATTEEVHQCPTRLAQRHLKA
jgi:hypothetical protein